MVVTLQERVDVILRMVEGRLAVGDDVSPTERQFLAMLLRELAELAAVLQGGET
jgi:hypothetical protein